MVLDIWLSVVFFLGTYSLSLPFIFKKAGITWWKGFLPLINLYYWARIMGKGVWWLIPLIFPGVNIYMLMIMQARLAITFGMGPLHWIIAFFFPQYFFYLAFSKSAQYRGAEFATQVINSSKFLKGLSSLFFAVIVVAIIRMYGIELYLIPTSSMERNLRAGDFLVISKLNYGVRTPQTPLAIPFMHHSIYFTDMPAFSTFIQWPYFRLPPLEKIDRGDIVAFNFPEGDTVFLDEQNRSYYQIVREQALALMQNDIIRGEPAHKPFAYYLTKAREYLLRTRPWAVRPTDKKEHYVKRCVALPADTLLIYRGVVYVNGKREHLSPQHQFYFYVRCRGFLPVDYFVEKYDVARSEIFQVAGTSPPTYLMGISLRSYLKILKDPNIDSVWLNLQEPSGNTDMRTFPNHPQFNWNENFFGPLVVPAKGMTIPLNSSTIKLYGRIIRDYEHNTLTIVDKNKYLINGKETNTYTFKMNYYFMVGDNRHNSLDSRFWGFVPEDHIMGKPVLVVLSFNKDEFLLHIKSNPLRILNDIRRDRLLKIPR